MNIVSIRVEGLFGLFKHTINFRRRERITILHGQNGVGKTTVLRMLKSLFAFEFYNLAQFHFSLFELTFDVGGKLLVRRDASGKDSSLKFSIYGDEASTGASYEFAGLPTDGITDAELQRLIGVPVGSIEDIIHELDQVGPRHWRFLPTGEMLGLDEVLNRFSDRLPIKGDILVKRSVPDWLRARLRGNQVYLIETQRLISQPSFTREYREHWQASGAFRTVRALNGSSAVDEISQDLISRISDALQRSGRIAAKLDSQFAYKLLTGPAPQINEDQIRERYAEYRDLNNRLVKSGFFENHYIYDLPTKVLEQADKKALSLYLSDVQEKLNPFKEILTKVLLFVSLVNARFKNKEMVVEKDKGIRFRMTRGASASTLDLSSNNLSSGEQHELVLLYTLLFKVPSGSLIAIDEPELSLHVTWQQKFLDDLKGMSETSNLDFLIATHSPSIINGRLDLTVELD